MSIFLRVSATLLVAAAGAFAVEMAGIAGGLLMGAALAVAVAAFLGLPATVPGRLRDVLFIGVGLTMGASVSPDTLSLMGQWPITIIGLLAELVVIVLACGMVLQRFFRLDPGTAYLSSFPGHLSFIIALATAGAGNARQITIIQTQRVMVLTLFAPIGALFLPMGAHEGASGEPMALTTLAMVTAGCAATGWIFTRLRLPAGYVIGSMVFATTMKLTGNFPGTLPPIVVTLSFVGIGALIGSRFVGTSRAELMAAAKGGMAATVLTIAITTLFALGLSPFVEMQTGEIWLALSPGGLESMGALGVALGYDTAFIASHHVIRLLVLTLAIPLAVAAIHHRAAADRRLAEPKSGR